MSHSKTDTVFREQMPVAQSIAYFDHAAVGPLTLPASVAIQEWCAEATYTGDMNWPKWNHRVTRLRRLAASLVNASPTEIAIVPNTTAGINFVALGLEWKDGDNIVLPASEFPSNLYPWKSLERFGVEFREVPLTANHEVDLDGIAAACDSRTRIVTCSWVGFASGYRIDVAKLAEIAHSNGAYFFLDAIQGLGVFPLDVKSCEVDFFAADGHKWMLGPEGAGLFYVSEAMLDKLAPQMIGWGSVTNPFDYSSPKLEIKPDASRYEGGSMNMVGVAGLLASLELLHQQGLSHSTSLVADHVLNVTDYLCDRLLGIGASIKSVREAKHASGIVSFDIEGLPLVEVRKHLLQRGIVTSCRGGWLRCAAHAYNDTADVDRLCETIQTFPR